MSSHSLQVGRLFGIPVRAHVSWLLLFALATATLAGIYFPTYYPQWPQGVHYALGLATSLLLFASVLLHELAHSLVARHQGLHVQGIVLFLLGGVSEISSEPSTPGAELVMAIAGPVASLAAGAVCALLWLPAMLQGHGQPLAAVLGYVCGINLSLGLFNLIPGFPLDGGRVLRAILWQRSHNLEWATRWATRAARLIAVLCIACGAWQGVTTSLLNGLWLAAIGCFLDTTARAGYQQVLIQTRLAGHTVAEIMIRDCPALSPDRSLQEIADQGLLQGACHGLPLVENGALLGVLTPQRLQAQPRHEWPRRTARQAMIPAGELHITRPSQTLLEAVNALTGDNAPPLPVLEDGQLVGMLTPERVVAFLKLQASVSG
ncbi:MAG TPA: site-2 protease family protein [Anaerolineae bacterium]|nr:site-2 protease family protein [Anaerolineae bacterium]HPL30186.1 site-2 protease family protein [Anaerolineae bacterium]